MQDFDLLVVGDCNPDLLVHGRDVQPVFGQVERIVDGATLTIGGSSSILACGAARLGLRTAFVGVVGDDLHGRFMLEALSNRGVDVSACIVDASRPTGLTVVLSSGQDRAMLTAVGTIDALRVDMIDRDLLRSARHVHHSGYFISRLAPDLAGFFAEAHALGLATSLDPQGDPSGAWDGGLGSVLPHVDAFMPNAVEARSIAGIEDVDHAATALALGGPTVAVKLGAAGALATEGDRVVRVPSPGVDTTDTTGAGDSFDAGFIAGRLAGWSLGRSLELATVCGALSTREVGGTASQPTLQEAVDLMRGTAL
jgi:sugar/nucleoside kinase (ribokinase family)